MKEELLGHKKEIPKPDSTAIELSRTSTQRMIENPTHERARKSDGGKFRQEKDSPRGNKMDHRMKDKEK